MKLTILMYHKIDEPPPGVRHPGNYVHPRQFRRQLDALLAWGYRTIDVDQWLDYRDGRPVALPRRPLVLTFDDGYTCFDDNAWPALRERGMRATVFLVAAQIGGSNAWDAGEVRQPLLGRERIRALAAEGVTFGSHTLTHPPLARIPIDRAREELEQSRQTLRDTVGRDVTLLAYPFSNQNRTIRELARQTGYRAAVRGKGRMNWRRTDPFGLRRIKVEPTTTIGQMHRLLFRERYLRIS